MVGVWSGSGGALALLDLSIFAKKKQREQV
jgi:hypothetical protein